MSREIMVSVLCTTYNQVGYIEQAIQGFLLQKTKFDYEILIHDDASTDGTAEIIKKYEKQFPDKIHCVYQTVNQYSQRKSVTQNIFNIARGKYISICEGDDFWVDDNKLQIQFDFMESHPEYSLCAHSGYNTFADGKIMNELFRPFIGDQAVDLVTVMEKWLFPTASLFYRKSDREPFVIPFAADAPCGDYPLAVFLALKGKVYYFDKPMSAYRRMADNSLSKSRKNKPEKQLDFNEKFINMLTQMNDYTGYQYSNTINSIISRYLYNNCLIKRDIETLMQNSYFKELNFFQKIKNLAFCLYPKWYEKAVNIKRRVSLWRARKNYIYTPTPFALFIERYSA